jgi:glycosyltransferase involved in cell wall biosynthesis
MLAKALAEKDEVVVVTTSSGSEYQSRIHNQENLRIVEVKTNNIRSFYDYLTRPLTFGFVKKPIWHLFDLWNLLTFEEIKKILREEQPDIIHTHGVRGISASLLSAIRHSGIPQVHTMHDYELISRWSTMFRNGSIISRFTLLDSMYMSFMRKMTSSISAVISPSKFLLDFHIKHGYFQSSKKYVIPYGIKHSHNASPKRESTHDFLFVGQITEHKGVQVAISAFRKLKLENARLHIVGDGNYLDVVKGLAQNDSRIIFYGRVKNEDLGKFFERCSFLIFPSIWYENFPLAIIEGMQNGLPVIASNIGSIPELVNDGFNGFLFKSGNEEALLRILEVSAKAPIHQLSNNAINTFKDLSMAKHITEIYSVYNSVLENKP